MGSEVALREDPIFQVKTVGSFLQKPGCPEDTHQALSSERIEHLCMGECYHPSDQRRAISRIEIVRIAPRSAPTSPWHRSSRTPGAPTPATVTPPAACTPSATPEFRKDGRDTLYYARVYEVPKPGINANNLRCRYDADGRCVEVDLCPDADGSDPECLAPHEPRAWSSPIYVDVARR